MTPLLHRWLLVYAAPAEGAALASLGAEQLGVGKVASAVALQALLHDRGRDGQRPAGVLLFGVGGAYPARHRTGVALRIGDLCRIDRDGFGDEGAMTPEGFRDLPALGLPALGPFVDLAGGTGAEVDRRLGAPVVAGTTVSTCSATEELSQDLAQRTGAAIESMEGAAVAHVCARHGLPFVQLRAIANWTGDRTRADWDLARAVRTVQAAVSRLLGGSAAR